MKKLILALFVLTVLGLSTMAFATCSAEGFTYSDEACNDCGLWYMPWSWTEGVTVRHDYEIRETPSGYCVTVTTGTYTGLCGDC